MIKNYKKLFLSFGAAAVLSSAAAFSSLAASGGWVSENGVWKYQEASGNYAYNTWKTSGDNSYYLDGVIAVNQWIDDTYYVDGDGVMAKNSWIQLSEDTSQKKAGWYYVDAKGKLIKDKWSTIGDKKYAFDSDGKMRTGWFFDNDDIYYLGDNGYAKTGWLCLDYDEDNKPDDGTISEIRTSASDTAKWFYFQTNGKAKRSKNDGAPVEFVYPEEGSPAITEPIGVLKDSRNQDAAEAFVDFVLSDEGQELAASIGYTPVKEGVAAPEGLKSIDQIKTISADTKELYSSRDADKEKFSEIFQ